MAGRSGGWRHAGPLGIFALLAVAWTWPLVRHLSDAIPGDPGDNYSFLWNLWWMRHVRSTAGLEFFRTTFLFYPFGTTLADHPHTALPGFIAATALGRLPVAAAQNVLLLTHVFANMASMYWLAWTITRHRRAAVLAGIIFGTSPYFAVHLLGHFDLMGGWVLPSYALLFCLAMERRSRMAAIGAGLVLAATTYTSYYYVVYLALFTATYVFASPGAIRISWCRTVKTPGLRLAYRSLIAVAASACAIAIWIALTGGAMLYLLDAAVSMQKPQNPLTLMWLAVLGAVWCTWRPMIQIDRDALRLPQAMRATGWIVAVFIVGCTPIILETVRIVRSGEYVTPVYFWRSAPRGIDLIAPLAGHPRHPLMRTMSQRVYAAWKVDYIETVAWIGIVPALLLFHRRTGTVAREARTWWIVAAVYALWAAGPFLTVAGFDIGLWLPESLARYIPFVANARVPGRAIIGVYMSFALLIAIRISRSQGGLRSAAVQWLVIAAVTFEYFDAPVPLTTLDNPATYQALAAAPPGAVCEVPFGLGDGLGLGAGSQDRRVLYYATIHAHPLVGGFLGRMPSDAKDRYEALPATSVLLRLSRRDSEINGTGPQAADPARASTDPCDYFIVNRTTASARLQAYVRSLPVKLLVSDAIRDVYRIVR